MTELALNKRCIVVTGLPSSGKTRVIQAALTQLPSLAKEVSLIESTDVRLTEEESSLLKINQVWCGFTSKKGGELIPPPLSALQFFSFKVGKRSLEHLLFGLDSSIQNLGMKIVRV